MKKVTDTLIVRLLLVAVAAYWAHSSVAQSPTARKNLVAIGIGLQPTPIARPDAEASSKEVTAMMP